MNKNKLSLYSQSVLLIVSSLICGISSANNQRIAYLSYTAKINDSPDFHLIEIIWSNGAILPLTSQDAWNFFYLRDVSTSTFTAVKRNDNDINERYKNYLLDKTGLVSGKYYVAWQINPSCDKPNNTIRVTFKIKFFVCLVEAKEFYDSAATNSLNDINKVFKVLVSPTGLELVINDLYDVDNTDTTNNSISVEKLLGVGTNYNFIAICS